MNTDQKLRTCFNGMVIHKNLKNTGFFSSLSLPSFTRDWILQRFEDSEGNFDPAKVTEFTNRVIPKRKDWTAIKSRLIKDFEPVRMLTKISVSIDVRTGKVSFSLPELGVSDKETIIEDRDWNRFKNEIINANGCEVWGMIELLYKEPEGKHLGQIRLSEFQNFCPYEINPEYYKDARSQFTTSEWIDILLGAVDYNASGYPDEESKLSMLSRLLPFAEERLNLVELAPKGTGKSYLFGKVSRYGWLSSGGTMSRAKMFYDINRRAEGIVSGYDFITLDEVQTISFGSGSQKDIDEMRAALKGYLEQGTFTVGNYAGKATAGLILSGNISHELLESEGALDMFSELPTIFHESALIDRLHGFINGKNIPRMKEELKCCGWALNSEYFCSILHELRSDPSYMAITEELLDIPSDADTRDSTAVKRIACAYLKLLFPNARNAEDVNRREFNRYCLKRAMRMRGFIKNQLAIIDSEYRGKIMPLIRTKGL